MGSDREENSCDIVLSSKELNQWQIAISEPDLEVKLLQAFDAAQQNGRDLDVTFTCEPTWLLNVNHSAP